MNDFTKEELQQIHKVLASHKMRQQEPDSNLIDKIESMILRHREHQHVVFFQEANKKPDYDNNIECHDLRLFDK